MNGEALPTSVTRGFVSYRRDDNEAFRGVVDRLRADIMARYEATTGKQLDIFLDRESIGWGEDWRQRIHDSVESATVFLPVITMRFFNSPMCMEELLTFHAAAARLGVTQLLLPIVLFGSGQIREDDPRPEVALIAKLNYKDFEDAWTAGYESPEWLALVAECVRDLDKAIQEAETRLVAEQTEAANRSPAHRSKTAIAPGDDDDMGIDVGEMMERMEALTPLTSRALEAVTMVADAASGAFEGLDGLSAQETKVRMIRAADTLKEPSLALEAVGEELLASLVSLDSDIRGFLGELATIEIDEARNSLVGVLDSFQTEDDLGESENEIAQVISMLKLVSLMNVSIRRSLTPAVRGLRAIQTAIGIFHGWQQLRGELVPEA